MEDSTLKFIYAIEAALGEELIGMNSKSLYTAAGKLRADDYTGVILSAASTALGLPMERVSKNDISNFILKAENTLAIRESEKLHQKKQALREEKEKQKEIEREAKRKQKEIEREAKEKQKETEREAKERERAERAESHQVFIGIDLFDGEEYVIDSHTYEIMELSPLAIKRLIKDVPHIGVTFVYEPLTDFKSREIDVRGFDITYEINKFFAPRWMKQNAKAEIPELFEKLINHLIPGKQARNYFYDWVHKSLTSRAYTYLVLCGSKGIGKGQLQKLLKALHGGLNYAEGKQSTLDSKFNSQLDGTRLVWFDEVKYTRQTASDLKRILNDEISIEKKGVDASRATKVYFSAVLSNNDVSDNYLEYDDRRFSPLELTERPLIQVCDQEWFDEFDYHCEVLGEDSPLVAQFGQWILEHGRDENILPQEPYKNIKFKEIVDASLSKWQSGVLELLTQDKYIERLTEDSLSFDFNMLSKVYGQFTADKKEYEGDQYAKLPKRAKTNSFIRNHKDAETGEPALLVVGNPGKERYVLPQHYEEYLKTECGSKDDSEDL